MPVNAAEDSPSMGIIPLFCCCLFFPLMMLQLLCRPLLAPELAALLGVLAAISNVLLGCFYSAAVADAVWLGWGALSLFSFIAHLLRFRHDRSRR